MDRNTPAGRKAYNAYMREYMRKRSRRLRREAEHERGRKKFWTPAAIEWLYHAYPNQKTSSLALAMGRDLGSVHRKAADLGIKKSREYLGSPDACRLRRGDAIGFRHQFPKGHVPANKGLRRPGYAVGRMKETQFKKGQRSFNWMPLQSERLADGYLYRKVGETGYPPHDWILVHRLNWMAAHGDIPPKHILVFKDRDRMNTAPENLEVITMRENMARNTVHNLPKPLAEVVQLRGALVRQINRRSGRNEKQDRGPAQPPVRDARGLKGQGEADGSRTREDYRRRRERDRAIREGRG